MMVLPWIVSPSQAMGFVGTTPSGAAHSTMLTNSLLPAKAVLAGMTTLMLWPLENGMPAVKGLCGCAAFETMEPLVGSAAPATTNKLSAASAAASSPTPPAVSRLLVLDIRFVPSVYRLRVTSAFVLSQ